MLVKLFSVLFGSAMTCKNKTTLTKQESSRKNELFDDKLQLLCTTTKFQSWIILNNFDVPLGSLVEIPFISCTTWFSKKFLVLPLCPMGRLDK